MTAQAATDDLTGIAVTEAPGGDLAAFVASRAEELGRALAEHGAFLVRGCAAGGPEEFRRVVDALGFAPLPYTERSTPRDEVTSGVYTSTEYPAREVIPQHCESSYAGAWPGRLAFFCATAPESGGATPIADVAAVLRDVPADVVEAVRARGLRYVRNYGSGVGLDWRAAFQTESREDVERFCAAGGLSWEWLEDDCLRTVRHAPGLAVHPRTGVPVWFNHLVLFHQSALRPEIREALIAVLGEDRLPNDVLYGDGTPIPDAVVDVVRGAFARHTRRFSWRPGDLLVIDNMRWSHGREAFTGERRILVSMSDAISREA